LVLRTVQITYNALRIRQCFLSGDFGELSQLTEAGNGNRGFARQSAWHCVWISALPYVACDLIANYSRCIESLELGILSFQTTFRLATLKSRLLQADFDRSRPLTDKIDRLYLWTWSWMVDPRSDHLERIIIWC
ncbi:MAG: hypothetical protein NTV34_03570, partial [Proteobacteria bacterium]|nr:hypothetical protein [Pseudomonadota bacterium]